MSHARARTVALDVAPRRASVTVRRARRATHAAASTSRGGDSARHLYNLLGVSPKATTKEIKSAYRRRALELHPDVNKAPDASARFNEVKEAYNVLVDPARREAYDAAATSRGRATATDWSDAWTRATSGARSPRASSSGARATRAREEEEFYGFGDFFRDLEKELAARDAARPAGAAPKSLWEELYEIGEEFVDFLEDAAPEPKPRSKSEFSRAASKPSPEPKKPSAAPRVSSQTVDDMLAELKRDMGL